LFMVPPYLRYKSRGASTLAGGAWPVGSPDATGLAVSVGDERRPDVEGGGVNTKSTKRKKSLCSYRTRVKRPKSLN